MKEKALRLIIGIILGIGGLCIIGIYSNWWVAGGAFLMLWGNNIESDNSK